MIVLWSSANVRLGAAFSSFSRFDRNGLRRVAPSNIATTVTSPGPRSSINSMLHYRHVALFSTTSESSQTSTTALSGTAALYGIDWVRDAVVGSLNDLFDPEEVARGSALAKLNKPKKKKKKKKKGQEEAAESKPEEPSMSDEEKKAIVEAAVAEAKPFSHADVMVTAATKDDFGDYQCNAAMGLAKAVGMNPR